MGLMISRFVLSAVALATAAFGQYKTEPAGAPPADLAPAVAQTLEKSGTRITGPSGVVCEIWFRAQTPGGAKTADENVTMKSVPAGALLGAIRFPGRGFDRRGQQLKSGVYTLRYGWIPVNGDHQGAAPQRDFLVMVQAAEDKDPTATSTFEALMALSKKASGTPHPAVLSFWKQDTDFQPGISKQGESDWVFQTKLGETPVAVIVVGTASS